MQVRKRQRRRGYKVKQECLYREEKGERVSTVVRGRSEERRKSQHRADCSDQRRPDRQIEFSSSGDVPVPKPSANHISSTTGNS